MTGSMATRLGQGVLSNHFGRCPAVSFSPFPLAWEPELPVEARLCRHWVLSTYTDLRSKQNRIKLAIPRH